MYFRKDSLYVAIYNSGWVSALPLRWSSVAPLHLYFRFAKLLVLNFSWLFYWYSWKAYCSNLNLHFRFAQLSCWLLPTFPIIRVMSCVESDRLFCRFPCNGLLRISKHPASNPCSSWNWFFFQFLWRPAPFSLWSCQFWPAFLYCWSPFCILRSLHVAAGMTCFGVS